MAGAIARLSRVKVPSAPKTTYSVGVVRGDTSINSIPFEVSMDVDMRSEACGELKKVDEALPSPCSWRWRVASRGVIRSGSFQMEA